MEYYILSYWFEITFYFFLWTFVLYWIHRVGHSLWFLKNYHVDHHQFILKNMKEKNYTGSRWHWNNLFLFNDTRKSTIDLWLTEVIPTILFSFVTGQWWISVFYYFWAAFIQEIIEHDPNFDLPMLTSGKWHLLHHTKGIKNYGLFLPIWDIVFKSNLPVRK